MKMTVKEKIKKKVRQSKSDVFVRADFVKLGSYDYVSKVLKELVDEGFFCKCGYGVYVVAKISSITGKSIPKSDLLTIGLYVMKRLGYEVEVGSLWRLNRNGLSTQMPMLECVALNKKSTMKIYWGKRVLAFEDLKEYDKVVDSFIWNKKQNDLLFNAE
jgi:hypothetical protein